MATKKTTTEVAVAETNTALAVMAADFAADAGLGMEGADKSSFAIPFLSILQGLSPQLETVDGAKPGLFINSITNEVFKEVLVIPCAFQRRFLRWAPRGLNQSDPECLQPRLDKLPCCRHTYEMHLAR